MRQKNLKNRDLPRPRTEHHLVWTGFTVGLVSLVLSQLGCGDYISSLFPPDKPCGPCQIVVKIHDGGNKECGRDTKNPACNPYLYNTDMATSSTPPDLGTTPDRSRPRDM